MAAALIELETIESVSLGADNDVIVLSRNVAVLQRSLARIAKDRNIRLERVEPLDDSLESVFSYIVEG